MSFVFISYSREDIAKASRLVKLLTAKNIDVFWDERIRFGEDHSSIILDRLEAAACIVVLWSEASSQSYWVHYEANEALERGSLIEAKLDKNKPPPPFGVRNTADLTKWRGGGNSGQIEKLLRSITDKINLKVLSEGEMSLAAPRKGQQVNDSHLALIHTCWRTPQHDEDFDFDIDSYVWDLMLFGSSQALNRVVTVTYYLHPFYEYPEHGSHSVNVLNKAEHRSTCFKLRQLASGHSLTRALVQIENQQELVKLSRYMNLFDTRDRIDAYFE